MSGLSEEMLAEDRLPKPYYDDGVVTIYHGDSREILPAISADVVLTDPPYGVGVDYADYRDSLENLTALIGQTLPLMLAAAPVVALTPGVGNVHLWPSPYWILIWRQLNALSSTGRWGFNEWQPVLVWGKDPFLVRGRGRRPDVIETSAGLDAEAKWLRQQHPCPKPLPSWKQIFLRVSPDEGDVIVDPFMGVGTTLAVAKGTGRRAIGIELSERYCEIAAERVAQETLLFRVAGDAAA